MIRAIVLLATTGGCLIAPTPLCDGAYDFAHAQVLGPEINGGVMNDSPFLTRDRKDLYFARDYGGIVTLFSSHRDSPSADWAPAVPLPFAQPVTLSNPYVTADNKTLYFTLNSSLYQLARTASTGQFDGTPTMVARPANAGSMSMTDDQLDIYYELPANSTKLTYHAHRPSADLDFPVNGSPVVGFETLGPTDLIGQTQSPGISSDGTVMLVATLDHQLYRATGSGDTFVPESVPLETDMTYDGSLTDDTIMIYARGGVPADIVTVERACNN